MSSETPEQGKPSGSNPAQPASGAPSTGKAATGAKSGPVIPKPPAAKAAVPAVPAAAPPAAPVVVAAPPSRRSALGGLFKQTPAWAISMLVHVIVLLSMALVVNEVPKKESPRQIESSAAEEPLPLEEFVEEQLPQEAAQEQVAVDVVSLPESATVEAVNVVSTANDFDAAPLAVELSDFGAESVPSSDLLSAVGAIGGKAAGGLGGRSDPKMRQQLIQQGGGTPDTEKAVEAALKWFINHQMPDGSWSFDLAKCPSCQGQCSHSGKAAKQYPVAGPTALAMLPFLGRGYTHRDGPYKKQMEFALNAIATKVVLGKGNAGEGSYVQGLVGICLSESYAMTKDPRLAMPAQLALAYVSASQDPAGGGWGYGFRKPGDTSILGWNLMALKSGYLAQLKIDPLSVKNASRFLDSVQTDEGSAYGYNTPGNRLPLNAAGLLCRMYLGWKKDNPALKRGADRLAAAGPNGNLYYDYYAAQVLHHLNHKGWPAWNEKMRDLLVNAQAKAGHEAGSWFDKVNGEGHGSEQAGRIYCTSLATMILEVYYRHLPIYQSGNVEEDFEE
jgi:hypothetical protein